MKVFLTSGYNYGEHFNPSGWLKTKSSSAENICTDNPELADIIIFVESHPLDDPYFHSVLKNRHFKKYPHKCVLYHDADLSVTPIPTLSPSIEAWQYNPKHKRTFHYIARYSENETIDQSPVLYNTNRAYLYSFIGSKTHAIRNKIINSKHPADTFIKDTTGLNSWDLEEKDRARFQAGFRDVINNSFFVLCPRGMGPCSYRLFEAMQLGRVPVIIADSWVKIPGINWDRFSITIPEAQVNLIPEILNERKQNAVEMGRLARQTWEQYFAPEVSLHHIAIAAKELLSHTYSFKDSLADYSQFVRSPFHLRNLLRYKKNKIKKVWRWRLRRLRKKIAG